MFTLESPAGRIKLEEGIYVFRQAGRSRRCWLWDSVAFRYLLAGSLGYFPERRSHGRCRLDYH